MSQTIFLLFIGAAVVFEVFADILFKASHLQGRTAFLFAGVVLYTIGTIIWAFSLKYDYLSKAISIFTIWLSISSRTSGKMPI